MKLGTAKYICLKWEKDKMTVAGSRQAAVPAACYGTDQIRCSAKFCLCNGTGSCEFFLLHTLPLQVPPSHLSCTCPLPLLPQILQVLLPLLNLFVPVTEQQQLFNFVRFSYPLDLPDAPKPATFLQKMPQRFFGTWLPLWNFSSRNRVTLVSIRDGV